MKRDFTEFDVKRDALLRQAILGDKDALGELLMMHRPMIMGACYRHLAKWRFQSHAEDCMQDALLDAVKSFRTFDPVRCPFTVWIVRIAKYSCMKYIDRSRVAIHSDSMTETGEDSSGGDDDEYRASPLDKVAYHAWETEQAAEPEKPRSMKNLGKPKRTLSRATIKARAEAQKAALAAKPKVRKKRDARFLTGGEWGKVNRGRAAFVAANQEPEVESVESARAAAVSE